MRSSCAWLILSIGTLAATDLHEDDPGKKAEQRACVPCHSLRLIESQRLSATAWKREINKIVGWGAVVPNQEVLLEYLSREFSDTKPVPEPDHSVSAEKRD
jgi:hypothetical protein